MTLLEPDLKPVRGARVVSSSLYDSSDPAVLTQDLLLVALPGETYIDVSWAPEHDPGGFYYVTVVRGPLELSSTTCDNPHVAIAEVESFAAKYATGDPL